MRAFSSIYQSQVKNFNKEHKRQKTRLSKNSVYNLARWRGHIMFVGSYSCTRYKHTHTQPTIPPFPLAEGPMLETSAFKLFTVANLRYQLS